MINQIEENIEKFDPSEMWHPHYYQRLLDFIEKPDSTKMYFWIEGNQLIVSDSVPKDNEGKKISNLCFKFFFSNCRENLSYQYEIQIFL